MYSFRLLEAPRRCASCGTGVTAGLAGHHYLEPMCETCFRLVAPDVAEALDKLRSETSIEHLEGPSIATCAHCGTRLEVRITGRHRRAPLCVECFRQHAPDLAALLCFDEQILRAARVSILPVRPATPCTGCGDQLTTPRFAGHHWGDPLCFACFYQHAPEIAALLHLHEAALEAAQNRDSRNLLDAAVGYFKLLHKLDARHPREPRPPGAS